MTTLGLPNSSPHNSDRVLVDVNRGLSFIFRVWLVVFLIGAGDAMGIDQSTRDWVVQRESGWRNVSGDGGKSVGLGQIQAKAWKDVSKARAKRGEIWWDYAAAWDRKINLIYTREYLEICRKRFVRRNSREPSRSELWAVYRGK